jgi:hypothetical protein
MKTASNPHTYVVPSNPNQAQLIGVVFGSGSVGTQYIYAVLPRSRSASMS